MLRHTIRSFSSSPARSAFARAQFLGSVGHVNLRETKDGNKFMQYSLAVNKSTRDGQQLTDWYNITVFNEAQVASLEKFLKSGSRLIVDADIRQSTWVDEENVTHHSTNFRQTHFELLSFGRRPESESEAVEESEE
ncbi:putative telomere binding protein [Scheffersomyces amazonensis]|uniref:putative telomere binding protein n=1 Tax=Scheffersomyces amazonensis TaxID=1078765 RepID=UPI00315D5660